MRKRSNRIVSIAWTGLLALAVLNGFTTLPSHARTDTICIERESALRPCRRLRETEMGSAIAIPTNKLSLIRRAS